MEAHAARCRGTSSCRSELQPYAYVDMPLPIGCDKTISQPFIVALMTDLLDPQPTGHVLEIGTGLGYQAAVLAELARKVYSVEIIEELAQQARQRLRRHGYKNIEFKRRRRLPRLARARAVRQDHRHRGARSHPGALIQQLKPGGRMVDPAGLAEAQQLVLVEKDRKGAVTTRELLPVRFSQLEGTEAQLQRGS